MDVLTPLGGLGYGLVASATNLTLTASTANLSLANFTVRANSWAVQDTYLLWARLVASRGATATAANLVVEMLVNGAVVRTHTLAIITTSGTNRSTDIRGLITCRSIGAGGSVQTELRAYHDITGTANAMTRALDPAPTTAHPATSALDTTAARTLELRARMSAAVASLTIYATHAGVGRTK